jgi:hypothetical protein
VMLYRLKIQWPENRESRIDVRLGLPKISVGP